MTATMSGPPSALSREGQAWPFRDSSRMLRVGRLDWHVQEIGEPGGPAVLLVHGTGASTHSFHRLMPFLAERCRVVAMDLPGHGFTTGAVDADLTLPGMARALSGLIGALGLQPALAIGHSAGVAILLQMVLEGSIAPRSVVGINAALEPIRGNTLLSPLARLLFANPLAARLVSFQARILPVTEHLVRATGSPIGRTSRECYAMLLRHPTHVRGALGMMANWHLEPLLARLGEIQVPVTLIAAADDPMVPSRVSERAAARMHHGRFVALSRGGHLVHEADPQGTFECMETPCGTPSVKSVA